MRSLASRLTLFLFLTVAAKCSFAATTLSKQAKASLLTIYPGDELFSAFGHSTLWFFDPVTGTDIVFSYGTYDFEQPNFYLNFVKGHLNYMLSTYSMEEQYLSAEYEQRKIVRQELALDSAQKQALFDFLEWNSLPENRYYLYDFYLDNCSSRLRDVLITTLGKKIEFDKSIQSPYSFRDWMNIFLPNHPLSALGMNIGLGGTADKLTDYSTQMYLPINLKLAFANARVDGRPLVSSEVEMLDVPDRAKQSDNLFYIFLFILLSAIYVTWAKQHFKWPSILFDVLLFTFSFVMGLILTFLWVATDHWVCAWNTDLLWANPLCLVYFFLIGKVKHPKIVLYLTALTLILSFGYFTIAYLLPEKPIFILFPLILATQLRAIDRFYHLLKTNSSL